MNDPNKRIDVNLSSLLSLKAELLRKHEEVNKAKSAHVISDFVPQRSSAKSSSKKESKSEQKAADDRLKASSRTEVSHEDSELLKKSRRVLEAKSKLYDKMCRTGGSLNSDEHGLVMFNQKKQSNSMRLRDYRSSSDEDVPTDRFSDAEDGEWVEYTDCLGRTRKCLKEDLDFFKKKDQDLAGSVSAPAESQFVAPAQPAWFEDTKGSLNPFKEPTSIRGDTDQDDTASMISGSSKIDEMRNNWEKQEVENQTRESIHYQNVLFDEARTHGVGYYAFSTDEVERAKQQKDLEATRAKTLDAQQKRDAQRAAREKIISERVRAAQNRQRARAGLPPIEDNPEPEIPICPELTAEEIKKQAKEAKANKRKEQEAVQREAARKQHVRPWDKGKDSSRKREHDSDDGEESEEEWQYKEEREPMSQDKWNELQRAQRTTEFAPVPEKAVSTSFSSHNRQPFVSARIVNEVSDHEEQEVDYDIAPPGTSHTNTSHDFQDLLPPINEFQSRSSSNAAKHKSFASSKPIDNQQRNKKPFVRRHTENVVSDEEIDEPAEVRRSEFAPPATFEYYGPTASGAKRTPGIRPAQLESSIEAGLKFLRQQSDKDTVSTKMKWASNAGY